MPFAGPMAFKPIKSLLCSVQTRSLDRSSLCHILAALLVDNMVTAGVLIR